MSMCTILAWGAKASRLAGHPVVEAGADGDEDVGLGHGHVGGVGAVHPQHPQPQGVVAGEAAQPHEGAGHRDLQGLGQGLELAGGVGGDDPPAGVEHRLLGRQDHLQGPLHLPGVAGRWACSSGS